MFAGRAEALAWEAPIQRTDVNQVTSRSVAGRLACPCTSRSERGAAYLIELIASAHFIFCFFCFKQGRGVVDASGSGVERRGHSSPEALCGED